MSERARISFALLLAFASGFVLMGAIVRGLDKGWIALLIGVSLAGLCLPLAYSIATTGRITLWLSVSVFALPLALFAEDVRRTVNHTASEPFFAFARDIVLILIATRGLRYYRQQKALKIESRIG